MKNWVYHSRVWRVGVTHRVFNATFSNISVISRQSISFAEETEVVEVNPRPVTSHWQILSHNVVSSTPRHELNSNSQILWWNQNLSYIFIFACKSTDSLLIYQCKHYILLKTYISRNKYIPQGERGKISTPNIHIHYYSLQWISANTHRGPSWSCSYSSWIYNYLCNQCLLPRMLWIRITIRARCTTLRDKVCQWLTTGRWFSPDLLVYSTNNTDRHDIA